MNKRISGAKFLGRNRSPRVHIQYDVDVDGAEKKVEIPFVMGVMSDLSGDTADPAAIADRKFLEFDAEILDARMKAMKPSVRMSVPNTLTGEGVLPIELTFEKMEDFTPAAIAKKVAPLKELLETRAQLENLLTWMDGRDKAEDLVQNLLNNPSLLKSLSAAPKPSDPSDKK